MAAISLKDGTAAGAPYISGEAGWAVGINAKELGGRLCKGGIHHSSEGMSVSRGLGVGKAAEKGFNQQKRGFKQERRGFKQQRKGSDRGGGTGDRRRGCGQQRGAHAAGWGVQSGKEGARTAERGSRSRVEGSNSRGEHQAAEEISEQRWSSRSWGEGVPQKRGSTPRGASIGVRHSRPPKARPPQSPADRRSTARRAHRAPSLPNAASPRPAWRARRQRRWHPRRPSRCRRRPRPCSPPPPPPPRPPWFPAGRRRSQSRGAPEFFPRTDQWGA